MKLAIGVKMANRERSFSELSPSGWVTNTREYRMMKMLPPRINVRLTPTK
jgi:hypothetical protein